MIFIVKFDENVVIREVKIINETLTWIKSNNSDSSIQYLTKIDFSVNTFVMIEALILKIGAFN
jgi:hypothetical protein